MGAKPGGCVWGLAGLFLVLAVFPPSWVTRMFSPGVNPGLGAGVLLFALVTAAGSVQLQRLEQSGIWRLSPYATAVPCALVVWWARAPLTAWAHEGVSTRSLIISLMLLAGLRSLAEIAVATAVVGAFFAPDATLMHWYAVPATAGIVLMFLLRVLLLHVLVNRVYSALAQGRPRRARCLAMVPLLIAPFASGAFRAMLLDRAGALHSRMGAHRTAIASRTWAVRTARLRGLVHLEATGLFNLATSEYASGRMSESLAAVSRAREVLDRYTARLAPDVVEHLVFNLALHEAKLHKDLGDFRTSLSLTEDLLMQARARTEQGSVPTWLRAMYSDLLAFKSAVIGVARLDPRRVLALLEQAYEVAESLGDEFRQFLRLHDQSASLVRLGRFGEARSRLERALRLLEASEVRLYDGDGNASAALNSSTDLRSWGLWGLSRIAWMQGDREEADRIAADAFAGAGPGNFLHAMKHVAEADALLNRGEVTAARTASEQALRLAEESGQEAFLRITHAAAGKAYERDGSPSDLLTAQHHYAQTIHLIETARSSLIDEASRLDFLSADSRIEAYAGMVTTHVALGHPQDAFDYAERGKARALLDHLGRLDQVGPLDHLGEPDDAAGKPVSHHEVHEMLDEYGQPALLVEYFTTEDQVIVIGLRGEGRPSEALSVPLSRDALRRFTLSNFGAAGRVHEMTTSGLQDMWHAFDPLVAPIASWARPGELVILVPHGLLHYLPLHALRVGGRYLIERNPVSYAPSASVLRGCRCSVPRENRGWSAAVLGDPTDDLPYARGEAVVVAGRFGAEPLLGEQATRDAFAGALSTADLVHYAGHARFVQEAPMDSGLLLSDGVLTSREIAALPGVRPHLITLSGCETGVSKDHPGDDTIGLLRGFLYSGARSMVATLWRVPDESTAFLVSRFYDHLHGNPASTKAHALRAAMLETLDQPGWVSLYHWAPFVLIGDWE